MGERIPLIPAREAPSAPIVEWPAVAERLREYAAARPKRADERCELCGAGVEPEHGHLVNVATRELLCACRPCYLLFTQDGAGARLRAVPQRFAIIPELAAAGQDWNLLQLPIGLAFFFRNGLTGRIAAFYPSPAGATESELPLDAWDALAREVPALSDIQADVEAVLVRRRADGSGGDALIVPIDACYELVGLIRYAWRGMQGGDELWRLIDEFFARATERAGRTAAALSGRGGA